MSLQGTPIKVRPTFILWLHLMEMLILYVCYEIKEKCIMEIITAFQMGT